jgi:hypothetical protein
MVCLDDADFRVDAAANKGLRGLLGAASKRKTGSVGKMSKAIEARTYEDALAWLRDHGFDVTEAPGTNGRVFLRKYNVSAAIQKTPDDAVKIFAYPGYLIGSEISKLVNRGYQQFLKTSKTEIPATADHLKALQSFSEELKEALGLPSLYNESLGTVSESYQYDRIENRDKPPVDRPKRPWEVAGKAVAAKKGRA